MKAHKISPIFYVYVFMFCFAYEYRLVYINMLTVSEKNLCHFVI